MGKISLGILIAFIDCRVCSVFDTPSVYKGPKALLVGKAPRRNLAALEKPQCRAPLPASTATLRPQRPSEVLGCPHAPQR